MGLLIAACAAPGLSLSPQAPQAAAEPVASTIATAEDGATVRQDGIALTVKVSPTTVAPGDSVTFTLALRNERSTPVVYATFGCFATVSISAPLPLEPTGREWTGARGVFKHLALARAAGPGGVPATDPVRLTPRTDSCPPSASYEDSLAPGARVEEAQRVATEYIGDVSVLPGALRFDVSAGYDRQNGPPSYAPDYTGLHGSWVPMFRQIAFEGIIDVEGEAPRLLTVGQAIDAALGDRRFGAFVEAQPDGTCTGFNVYLYAMPSGAIFPPGPAWQVEVFCENGVPRHFARAAVDVTTGEVLAEDECPVPCDR